MIGVTIAIGPKFRRLARGAAEAVKRHYGISHVVTLGEEQLARYCPPRDRFPDFPKQVFFLKFCVPLIVPKVERWLYFDADYRPIRDAEPHVIDAFRSDTRIIAVDDWWPDHPYPWRYYNAGFYVANRPHHDRLFDWCRTNYFTTKETYGDQCVWNAGIAALGLPVLELPRQYNANGPHVCENPVAAHGYWYAK